ncbi:MAG: hypothetical protein L6R40_001342 [Gallowayella cf. fulva]|nr:MAG: hypothetical protein L6R40_001342 [Xanthomendoza cf. fulva]
MHGLRGKAARSCRILSAVRPALPVTNNFGKPFLTFATSVQRNDSSSSRPPKVTWYQQLFPGARDRIKLEPEHEDAEVSKAEHQLRQRITELEEELGELRGDRPSATAGQHSLIEPLLEQLSEEDRRRVRLALQQTQLSDAENAEIEAESEALTNKALGQLGNGFGAHILQEIELDELEIAMKLAPEQKAHLRRFNACLKNAASNASDAKTRKDLWISYERCKRLLPSFIDFVPEKCWDIIWKSQHAAPSEGRDRAPHLAILAHDILQGGKELSEEQRTTLIETYIKEGRLEEAHHEWQLQQSSSKTLKTKIHGSQGVRLFLSRGDLEKAQEIAENTFDATDPESARNSIPIIKAWAQCGLEDATRTAWCLYLDFRKKLGSSIDINDFDTIALGFVNAGRTDMALAVFKDMMLNGRKSQSNSNQLYKTSLTLLETLQSKSASPSELITVSLSALTTLPREYQNKFFYGSWIKKLIGMGETQAAVSVIELMYERGVTPDAKHVNGIIGAWFRSGQPSQKEKAEQLGWAMIQRRLKVVSERRGEERSQPISRGRVQAPAHIQRVVPPATIETFSLLLLYYERRSKSSLVHTLKEHLDLAAIPPNSYFMNHMLYAELRRGQLTVAWQLYQAMKDSVKPDLETFACLWDCEKARLYAPSVESVGNFPGPREVYREFMAWFTGLDERKRAAVRRDFSEELYNQIVRCMCLAKDLEGTLVVLYSLMEAIEFLPNDETLRMIPIQVARIGFGGQPMTRKRQRSRLSRLAAPVPNSKIRNISRVLELVAEQRIEALERDGVKLEDWNSQRQLEEQVHILAEFLRVVLRRELEDEKAVEKSITVASEEMGVEASICRIHFTPKELFASSDGAGKV